MVDEDTQRLSPGQQPYDSLNGLRVGVLAGGLLGALGTWAFATPPWPVFVLAAVGGAIGYWSERQKQSRS